MKYCNLLFSFIFLCRCLQLGKTILFEGVAVGLLTSSVAIYMRCKFQECCTQDYVLKNTNELKFDLENKLYGQRIAADIIFSAIHSHVFHSQPKKALVLSLHGMPGTGKNYVVSMIANALFKFGEKSKYYKFYNGRSDFPDDNEIKKYKSLLTEQIKAQLDACSNSLIIFDEVDKMPAGLLDVLVPFLDYSSWHGTDKSKSIFIFLSNTGSNQIVKRMIALWEKGVNRDNATLQDFESLITIGAFNEVGGFYKSSTIQSKLVDHHVPFLPLEEEQVIKCLYDAFKHWGVHNPSEEMIKEVLQHVTYGPPPYNLYSTSGCKRLDHKVSALIYKSDLNLDNS